MSQQVILSNSRLMLMKCRQRRRSRRVEAYSYGPLLPKENTNYFISPPVVQLLHRGLRQFSIYTAALQSEREVRDKASLMQAQEETEVGRSYQAVKRCSHVPVDAAAEYPEAGHDFVPVQVGALQVSQPVWSADVALPSMQQTPVVKGHQSTLTWLHCVGDHVLWSVHEIHKGPECSVEGLNLHEITVVRPRVGEVHVERGECLEGLWVLSPQLLGHVEAVHHLALPSLHGLVDAVQELHLKQATHTCCTNALFTALTTLKAKCQQSKQTFNSSV
ncbi:hypothetical protein INR49_020017 [Caranx melampygus]|nr:hypothetical protein INR49_020017 [Caranx melampygus]